MPEKTEPPIVKKAKKLSSRTRIKNFLLERVGQVVNGTEIRDAIGTEASEWARSLRELLSLIHI